MGAKPSEFAWRARKGADGGTGAKRGQPSGTRARGRCGRYGRAARPARGTGGGQPGGTRARWARGRAGGQSASPPAQLARTTQIPPPSASDSPQTPSGRMPSHPRHTPARTRLPDAHSASQRVPPPGGGCVRLPSAHPPLEASPAPWRAPGGRPRRAPSPRRVWLPADAPWAHAQPSPARTPRGGRPAPRRAPGPARTSPPPEPHPAPDEHPGGYARLPDAHLASTRPTTFWPFSSRFTQPGAFRNAILAIFAMLYVETSLRHA